MGTGGGARGRELGGGGGGKDRKVEEEIKQK